MRTMIILLTIIAVLVLVYCWAVGIFAPSYRLCNDMHIQGTNKTAEICHTYVFGPFEETPDFK